VINVDKDMVFYYLKDNENIYAYDTDNDTGCDLRYESVDMIHKMLNDDEYVFFTIKEDEE
jgi:hypothetical protein